jgi:uncharacterized protein (DUF849 family)
MSKGSETSKRWGFNDQKYRTWDLLGMGEEKRYLTALSLNIVWKAKRCGFEDRLKLSPKDL